MQPVGLSSSFSVSQDILLSFNIVIISWKVYSVVTAVVVMHPVLDSCSTFRVKTAKILLSYQPDTFSYWHSYTSISLWFYSCVYY